MKFKNSLFIKQNTSPFKQFRSKHQFGIPDVNMKTRGKECEENLSKFC